MLVVPPAGIVVPILFVPMTGEVRGPEGSQVALVHKLAGVS